ncbi:MAG: AAA family ATPase [Gammaproteobacteria bacterium]|nr:AAA family ATPase [Gammaproteobacteria bacterium]MCY4312119.1 AAA family ATPase [Gammaproteobacteria bacterium]
MIHKVSISHFKKFDLLEFTLPDCGVICGPNNSGKTTLLQSLSTWSELGELWLRHTTDLTRKKNGEFHSAEVDIVDSGTLPPSISDELWHNKDTRKPISISVSAKDWSIGFSLHYQDASIVRIQPLAELSENHLKTYAESPLKALYIPSLSWLDIREPEYTQSVIEKRLAHSKGGIVLRNIIKVVSSDSEKWEKLQFTVKSFFGFELSKPSGDDPIMVRYKHLEIDHWYDLVNGAAGFLQILLLQSALLHSDAKLFLIDEPDAHLHALLKERIYALIKEHCRESSCQALIATHSGRLIDMAARENGNKLFVISKGSLNPITKAEADTLLKIPAEQIVFAQTSYSVLYLEGKSDLDILLEWAKTLDHPALKYLNGGFWVPVAEKRDRKNFAKKHFKSLKVLVPNLNALEVRDPNSSQGLPRSRQSGELIIQEGKRMPRGMKLAYWSRYEIENYLLHRQSLLRFVSKSFGAEKEERARIYMEKNWPSTLLESPFEPNVLDQAKGKAEVQNMLSESGINFSESDFHQIAGIMKPGEIHPNVASMLDLIENQMSLQDD